MTRSWPRRRLTAGCAGLLAVILEAAALGAIPAAAANTSAGQPAAGLVIQVDLADGYTIRDVTARFAVSVDRVMVARAGIYRLLPTRRLPRAELDELADDMEQSRPVQYAVPDPGLALDSSRFHSWPSGVSSFVGSAVDQYRNQPLTSQLTAAQQVSRGAGVRVAVLDTGVAADHPALRGKVVSGYDYVDDDADPSERRAGVDTNGDGRVDSSYGHGTFVAGLVSLVAPAATIMPMRVLDSDGVGNEIVIAQAIRDAVKGHADVINLSFGSSSDVSSDILDSALYFAENAGVLVVIAAGNTGGSSPLYPADSGDALAVTAVGAGTDQIAGYASRGSWVELAAPGTNLIGPVPGGGYARWSGTSMAAPVVAGQTALVEAAAPELTLDQTVKVVTSSAKKIGSGNVRYGIIDIAASVAKAR